jgi:hypothetical protein
MLTSRWRVLRSPLSASIKLAKVNAFVVCLCNLHDYGIDKGNSEVPEKYVHDTANLMDYRDLTETNTSYCDGKEGTRIMTALLRLEVVLTRPKGHKTGCDCYRDMNAKRV